ncbi:MAG TPA: polyribonucleotide nucleotidyltransferase [Clostridia bacterium]|nr:polyribonucleotide nucleotidyltransferase [Clostridia bacterium]
MDYKVYSIDLAGTKIEVEIGRFGEQASGACTVKCGDTVVFVSATGSKKQREGIDFFPLSVDFEEKLYAVGRIPGGFIKREGRPTERAILISRLIDRPIRPLFPEGYRKDVQIVAMPLSVDPQYPPDIFAMLGSSIALSISDLPFSGPTGSVIVGLVDGEYVINPISEQREKSLMNVIVAGTKEAIMMVEADAKEVPEEQMLEAIMFGHEYIKQLVEFQENIVKELGKAKLEFAVAPRDSELETKIWDFALDKMKQAVKTFEKKARESNMEDIENLVHEHLGEEFPEQTKEIDDILYDLKKHVIRNMILDEGVRPDGRTATEIRTLSNEVGLLPRTHGSGFFKRGQTHVLTTCTLGPMADVQMLDGLWEDETKRYMHHYNFPPYSVGETRPMRGPGRRDIGHGALAERAMEPVIPNEADFPYAIRLVSEVMSSNGSSSMGSVCGSTLALMDAGVPIKAPVSGIAMGLIKAEDSDKLTILSDIQGMEDFMGDMDFKVAGTAKGVTAIQMDIKIKGIEKEILAQALEQSKIGRAEIMESMLECIDEPRKELATHAPKIITTTIHPDKIRDVIGPGGKVINGIIAETGVKIDIEDDGHVFIYSPNQEQAKVAFKMIEDIVKDAEVGKVYEGTVMRIMNFGAFVEILPGKEGLVHISKLAHERVEKVEDIVKVGDKINVKVSEIDGQGRINLSRKDTLPPPEGGVKPQSSKPSFDRNKRPFNKGTKRNRD